MSKNLSQGIDKGQGVKKYNSDGSKNKVWKNIHYGTKMPRGSQECGHDRPEWEEDVYGRTDEELEALY